ncbi:MAG: hypothetical protein IJR70_00435 [Eubacterium sp.]|nr:hypothetical protein [Eubacterium sp.]
MKKTFSFIISLLIVLSACSSAYADDSVLNISQSKVSHEVSKTLYGAFIEDISFACDGGLVSNLVNNGSFEYEDNQEAAWNFRSVAATLSSDSPMSENNPTYEIIGVDGRGYIENIGFPEIYNYKTYDVNSKVAATSDMGFKENEKYEFSIWMKNIDFSGTVGVYLNSKSNAQRITQISTNMLKTTSWNKFSVNLTSNAEEDGSLIITFNGKGNIAIDFVSLVPCSSYGYGSEEWKYTTLRTDLFNSLKNIKPSFIRFPGGCLAEGTDLKKLYNWKNTIGAPEEREQSANLWRDSANSRNYNNTNAMGYHEYFQLCEDLGAEAVPVVNAGMICQARVAFDDHKIALEKSKMSSQQWKSYLISVRGFDEKDEEGMKGYTDWINSLNIKSEKDYNKWLDTVALRPGTDDFSNYVQDVLDLIEYANADSKKSYWGELRAKNGHMEPFNIKYIAVGNENWGDVYFRNFDEIYKAIKEKYPDIKVISSAGAASEGEEFEYSWNTINKKYSDTIADEHYYTGDNYLFEHNDRYDSYDRDGAGVFIGEYSAKCAGFGTLETKTNLWSAVEEASYLTGLERNSDIVKMASYAPTFAKINANCWDLNMIWFDSQKVVLTPDYYVQMLFSNNTGEQYVETQSIGEDIYQSVTVDSTRQIMYIKLVNAGSSRKVNINLDGFGSINAVSNQFLTNRYKSASNELDKQRVAPEEKKIKSDSNSFKAELKSNSINVIRVAYGENTGESFYSLPDNIDLKTKGYVPTRVIAAVLIIATCFILGSVGGFLVYAKVLKKKGKENEDEAESD